MRKITGILAVLIFCACLQQKENSSVRTVSNSYYSEQYRPQYHFTPDSMWMNDPNGMVFHEGEYHLFYQYYPDSNIWGPMHWGHAVSEDMVNWEHLPIALYPDDNGYIFSGSAVVDKKNTSGLGQDGKGPMVAIFTYHDPVGAANGENDYQTQGLAFSNNNGRTWEKYPEPVLKNPGIADFRDPKVSWVEEFSKWIMALAVQDHIEFYASTDLINWEKTGEFGQEKGAHGGVWECPDLFPVKIEGTNETKWVLLVSINPGGPQGGSATQYFIGDFDGKTFSTTQNEEKWLDHGSDNYAGVIWNGIPQSDGRCLFIGWMSNWLYAQKVPTQRWRSAMTLPRQLKLRKINGNYILASAPVKELETLRLKNRVLLVSEVSGYTLIPTANISVMQSEMLFNFKQNKEGNEFGIQLSNKNGEKIKIGYSQNNSELYIDRTEAGTANFSDEFEAVHRTKYIAKQNLQFHVFIDKASIEVFVDNGNAVLTDIFFPGVSYNKVELFSTKGSTKVTNAAIWQLSSVW
ncbi:glycoside hydrolase family 32 protein [Draconibacterium halophilum]|uniref:Glycoside hydrolase family 32 protein n=1 Tax=Draconibacterium halophilum TaxID=2706887 RepID=A0A6C0RF59_9BACT|nr:glycoside hydrolase family 32 protein [Draconibacterium halophilum]QIA07711.1 glycoside hydrolase family 32 protein [Draconibacterium halophilum]